MSRKERRSPFEAYQDWYTQYSKNNLMQSAMLEEKEFYREYNAKIQAAKLEGRKPQNPARMTASEQMVLSYSQKKVIYQSLKQRGEKVTMRSVGFGGRQQYVDMREELFELDPSLRPPKPYKEMTKAEKAEDKPRRDRLREAFGDRLYHK